MITIKRMIDQEDILPIFQFKEFNQKVVMKGGVNSGN